MPSDSSPVTITKFLGLTAPQLVLAVSWPKLVELGNQIAKDGWVAEPVGKAVWAGGGMVYVVTKCYPIVVLARAANKKNQGSLYAHRMSTGLALSALGDLFLALPGDTFFGPGLGSFLLAHLFYISAYESRTPSRRPILGAAVFVVAGTLARRVLLPHVKPEALKPAVVVYIAALAGMLWRATARWMDVRGKGVEGRKAAVGAAGALAFVVSDFCLAYNKFVAPLPASQMIVMSTYYAAQFGIAASV
ncbi:hypothetical protein HDU96_003255 [Phlyctochytrium bullatum]|nr:hypothetical protein HDU96_003255 [Phlyctochytrium bullatum]